MTPPSPPRTVALRKFVEKLQAMAVIICGPCGGPYPNPECGHRGRPDACKPAVGNIDDQVADDRRRNPKGEAMTLPMGPPVHYDCYECCCSPCACRENESAPATQDKTPEVQEILDVLVMARQWIPWPTESSETFLENCDRQRLEEAIAALSSRTDVHKQQPITPIGVAYWHGVNSGTLKLR